MQVTDIDLLYIKKPHYYSSLKNKGDENKFYKLGIHSVQWLFSLKLKTNLDERFAMLFLSMALAVSL